MLIPEVVDVLVERHRQFRDFLERRVGSRATAEELLQTAFVKTLERGSALRESESSVAWFYRLLRNALIDFYREPDPALENAVCQCVHALIPTLKEDYAGILRTVDMEGATVGEAATRLNISPGNAAVRLHRARQALRHRLTVACGTCTDHGCLDCTCETSKQ